ncbi:MAG: B12-binding domain-containing radical SAM protein [Desulfobulbaceae bacterium S3730MH12]|nr:MAG: B12-binding domain-containing radical SAM protein [Desulfobulbaceae bacterium S3730MH12]OEU82111.1 MAG: B12-binding domain-containing radical SAM protein [Desulfobulbaceae bacterium C00003063]
MTDSKILPYVTKPGRYLGREYNSIEKPWESAQVRCALIFPDLYEIGMSHQGLQILYHILNSNEKFLAERCYCPDIDVENLIREKKQTLTTLESGHPLTDFDLLGITLPYELCYSNILTILDLAGLPFLACERNISHPLVVGGGAGALNPEPVADFFDAVLLGDGEEAMVEIAEFVRQEKDAVSNRARLLDKLSEIKGVYIPSHFRPQYDENNRIAEIKQLGGSKSRISRRILPNLDAIDHLKYPIVPNARIVHDRLGIEIARGCTRGCRFCQAGITYRPVRERSPKQITELAIEGINDSGFEELALLSLSTGDYSCIEQILPELMNRFADGFTSVSMPSMRVGTLTSTIMDQIKRVRKTGFTLAPEAGSERLRRVINKGISEEDLITTCKDAFTLGWKVIKLYFMIGLPTETEEDIDEIIQLVKKVKAERDRGSARGKKQVNVSVGTFVPKPHTPFQWERQLTLEESNKYLRKLKDKLPHKGVNLKYHNPRTSYLEGVFSRGDRRLAELLATAWQDGARLDGWTEHFNLDLWQRAAEKCNIDLDDYLRARSTDDILPWQHLHSGVDTEFLKEELEKGKAEVYTPDCRYHACQECGSCDFETIFPIVHNRSRKVTDTPVIPARTAEHVQEKSEQHNRYIVHYSRIGSICFLGHLEILQVVFRALRRAEIETNYSKGFNPSPKISFGPALAVGTESLSEFFIMDLPEQLPDTEKVVKRLNSKLPPGLKVSAVKKHPCKIAQKILTSYTLTLDRPLTGEEVELVDLFVKSSSFIIERIRKGKMKPLDIRPLIRKIRCSSPNTIKLKTINVTSSPGIKPIEALLTILKIDKDTALRTSILKTGWLPLQSRKKD